MMRRAGSIVLLLTFVWSCGGGTVGGRSPGPTGDGGRGDGSGGDGGVVGRDDAGNPVVCSSCSADEVGKGTSNPWAPAGDNSNGVMVDADGALSLIGAGAETLWVWVANSVEGTVSKLDPRTGREVARYPSAVTHPANGSRPWSEQCDMEHTGNCPSRTAIDFFGNAWVANRAFDGQGTVTKIAGSQENCDQTGGADGVFRTSQDVNGDGRIDITSPQEFPGDADDCVRFTVNVGGPGGVPRALAVAPDPNYMGSGGAIWVGLNLERKAVELDGLDGRVIAELPLKLNPYGALAAKHLRVVWFTNAGWQRNLPDNPPAVQAVSYVDGTVGPRHDLLSTNGDCNEGGITTGSYGIGVDLVGRVWIGGYPCTAAFRYDPTTDAWLTVNIPGVGATRGIVVDREGDVWVAHSHCPTSQTSNTCGKITRFSSEDGSNLHTFDFDAKGTIGVDFDGDGNLWGVNQGTNNVVRITPSSGATAMFPVGEGPYTYSDFTGHSLRLQFGPGQYRQIFNPCPEGQQATWEEIDLVKEEPPGTSVEVSVRVADDLATLQTAQWLGPWVANPALLQGPPGPVPPSRYLEIELMLDTSGDGTPRVLSMAIRYYCTGPVQ
jgi:streptogramin lyase